MAVNPASTASDPARRANGIGRRLMILADAPASPSDVGLND